MHDKDKSIEFMTMKAWLLLQPCLTLRAGIFKGGGWVDNDFSMKVGGIKKDTEHSLEFKGKILG